MNKVPWSQVIPTMRVGDILHIPHKTLKAKGAISKVAVYTGYRVRVYPSPDGGIELWRTK